MMRFGLVAMLALVAACGLDKMSASPEDQCPGNGASVSLVVTPERLGRGASDTVAVTWQVDVTTELSAEARFVVYEPNVEVLLPLEDAGAGVDTYPTFVGSLVNPFGLGMPSGEVYVIAAGNAPSCLEQVTATTSLVLE